MLCAAQHTLNTAQYSTNPTPRKAKNNKNVNCKCAAFPHPHLLLGGRRFRVSRLTLFHLLLAIFSCCFLVTFRSCLGRRAEVTLYRSKSSLCSSSNGIPLVQMTSSSSSARNKRRHRRTARIRRAATAPWLGERLWGEAKTFSSYPVLLNVLRRLSLGGDSARLRWTYPSYCGTECTPVEKKI